MGAVIAKALAPERMSLPSRGATFDLSAWLPEPVRSEFLFPKSIRRRNLPSAPRSRVHSKDWPSVLRQFDNSGMLMLAREDEVPRDGYGRIPRNGCFVLDKDADWDRVVCARKPSNSLETSSKLAGDILPHGSLTCEKQLSPDRDWILRRRTLKIIITSAGLATHRR